MSTPTSSSTSTLASRPVSAPSASVRIPVQETPTPQSTAGRYVVLAGRILFVSIFLMAAPFHFSQQDLAYAVAQGVPMARLLVPASGLLALAGALSVALGYRAKAGAWLLVLFLVPVTVSMHRFWGLHDPATAQLQMAMFMKNLSILGGALLISQFGAGPLSLDAARGGSRRRDI
jgi:putative oxidoreductase